VHVYKRLASRHCIRRTYLRAEESFSFKQGLKSPMFSGGFSEFRSKYVERVSKCKCKFFFLHNQYSYGVQTNYCSCSIIVFFLFFRLNFFSRRSTVIGYKNNVFCYSVVYIALRSFFLYWRKSFRDALFIERRARVIYLFDCLYFMMSSMNSRRTF